MGAGIPWSCPLRVVVLEVYTTGQSSGWQPTAGLGRAHPGWDRGWSVVLREVHPSTPCRLGGVQDPSLFTPTSTFWDHCTIWPPPCSHQLRGRARQKLLECHGLRGWPASQVPPGWNTVGILVVTRDAQSWPRFKQRGDVALSGTQTQQISSGGYFNSQNSSHTWVTNARGWPLRTGCGSWDPETQNSANLLVL